MLCIKYYRTLLKTNRENLKFTFLLSTHSVNLTPKCKLASVSIYSPSFPSSIQLPKLLSSPNVNECSSCWCCKHVPALGSVDSPSTLLCTDEGGLLSKSRTQLCPGSRVLGYAPLTGMSMTILVQPLTPLSSSIFLLSLLPGWLPRRQEQFSCWSLFYRLLLFLNK